MKRKFFVLLFIIMISLSSCATLEKMDNNQLYGLWEMDDNHCYHINITSSGKIVFYELGKVIRTETYAFDKDKQTLVISNIGNIKLKNKSTLTQPRFRLSSFYVVNKVNYGHLFKKVDNMPSNFD